MKKLRYILKRFFFRKPDIWRVDKFHQFHLIFFLLLSVNSFGQQLKVYKEKGVWKYDQTGPLNTYPIAGGIISDTTSIPDPPVVTTPPPGPIQEPFKVMVIPGTIEAEDYDKGGEVLAWEDIDNINQGITTYRPDAVDIEAKASGGGYNIGWTAVGDYYEYTVNVTTAGTLRVEAAVASITTGSSFQVQVNGSTIGTLSTPNTGGWQTWQTVFFDAAFTTGLKVIRLNVTGAQGNIDYIKFGSVPVIVTPPPATGTVVNVSTTQNLVSIASTARAGTTLNLAAGTFVISQLTLPVGVTLQGAGIDQTILRSVSSFYYPNGGTFAPEKYLIQVKSNSATPGNQSLKGFTIDGDGKQLHGGILVEGRSGVVIENVRVQYANFSGIWLNLAPNSILKGIQLKDCAWGSSGWCSGALQIANSPNTDVSGFDIDEGEGYGIKNLGHTNGTPVTGLKIHDGRVSVIPRGAWANGSAPNITIELWGNSFPGTEIYNCYIDNTLSLVNPTEYAIARATPIKIYNNNFDINGRSGGGGYSIELSINDAEVYNNYFAGGSTAMVNWHIKQCMGWNIHHNTFYNIGRAINSQCKGSKGGGLKDVTITNNTVEMNSGGVGFVELNSSNGDNVKIQKNLFIGTSGTPAIVSCVNGATMVNSIVSDNFYSGSLNTNVSGVTPVNNLTGDPLITKTGARPTPYYKPLAGSPLLTRDIGAFK